MDEVLDLSQQESLIVGEGDRDVILSEPTYNLVCSLLAVVDNQDRWGKDGLDLGDGDWPDAVSLIADALWELS
jgi:hypothetical protein